jgi:hypothetical protein
MATSLETASALPPLANNSAAESILSSGKNSIHKEKVSDVESLAEGLIHGTYSLFFLVFLPSSWFPPAPSLPAPPSFSKTRTDIGSTIPAGHVLKEGVRIPISWTKEEQRRVVRKADLRMLPILTALFFFMALDRTNIAGVLTSTFLKDTGMTKDDVSQLLCLAIVSR